MGDKAGAQHDFDSARLDNLVRQAASADVAGLMSMWRAHDQWPRFPEIYRAVAQAILGHGEPLLAYDVIAEGLTIWPSDLRLRQLQGLSLARSGATERANAVLEKLRGDGQTDEETLGMLGRTYKDLAATAASVKERGQFLKRAAETYAQAYQITGGYWSGINAATMNLLIGKTGQARELARKVRDQCLKELENPSADLYWELAALGEAALIFREWSQAEDWYARAAQKGAGRFGDLHSSRRNAHLILQYWNETTAKIDHYLRLPPVIAFAGHMIDHPDRKSQRFPAEAEAAVAGEIRARICNLKPGFGFASAACGSDILFLEAMLEAGAEISIVLPYNKEEFVRDSVDFIPASNWAARFERVLEQSTRVLTASPQKLEVGGVSYDYCNQLLLGLATIRSRQLDTALLPLAVWNGRPGDGPGGASSVVKNWRALGYNPEIIDLAKISLTNQGAGAVRRTARSVQEETKIPATATQSSSRAAPTFGSRVVSILFADAVGFSKLHEAEVPKFVGQFLGAIAQWSAQFADSIIAKNTWGDGLYHIFSDVDAAGTFALGLADIVAKTEWEKKGLPAGLNLRIALHAGPAYEFDDPITGRRSYSGAHVNRAARLESITPPGQVYASEAFAALAAAQRTHDFTCDYVGQTPMAKGYGTLPAYHVRPRTTVPLMHNGVK